METTSGSTQPPEMDPATPPRRPRTRTGAHKPRPRGQIEVALGARFRAVRRRQRAWLVPLAKAIGTSVNTIRWHESGARPMRSDLLVRAAEAMGVDPTELVSSTTKAQESNDGTQGNP